ncbi:sigma-70 family RNA polymerase sigma factor [Bacillus phage vB_BceM-HSE3]|nr:sigma-70 family RNA polymerase sigma factor [Bacillus phage vB_BceM-HSE3]
MLNHNQVTMNKKVYDNEARELTVNQYHSTNEIPRNIAEIVEGVASKYGNSFGMSKEDIQQELYIKLLETNLIDESQPKLVARTCYNKAVDIYRYERRRYNSRTSYEGDELASKLESTSVVNTSFKRVNPYLSPEKHYQHLEMIDLFEQGTRERKVIVIRYYQSNIFDLEECLVFEPSLTEEMLLELKDTEGSIAQALGLKGCNSGSYQSVKKRIRLVVRDYLNS